MRLRLMRLELHELKPGQIFQSRDYRDVKMIDGEPQPRQVRVIGVGALDRRGRKYGALVINLRTERASKLSLATLNERWILVETP